VAEITISSRDYKQQLVDLYYGDVREFVVREGEPDGSFFFTIRREGLDAHGIAELFEDIILGNNTVLASSPKLYEIVRDLVFSAERPLIARDIEEYFRQHKHLCIEGYLNFRLAGAPRRVNRVLYSLMKRCLHVTKYRIGEAYDY